MLLGNDYGVCCPASLKIQKPGMCPNNANVNSTMDVECDAPCAHDLECPSMQKCCHSDACGKHCVFPENLTGIYCLLLVSTTNFLEIFCLFKNIYFQFRMLATKSFG